MRKGMTLVELIFSMVIISIVFSIVPKIIFASNKSMETSMKEDALFNAYTLLGSITKLAWDEETYTHGEILNTDTNTCNDKRVGGFFGSRNCKETSNESASAIGQENGSDDYNDIDDYNGYTDTSLSKYKLGVAVDYVDNTYVTTGGSTSELKEIKVTVESNSAKTTGFKSSFFYHSANLGHIQIKKEIWQ